MTARPWVPVALFLGGVACIASAVATGEAEVDLVVIFPVFSGSSGLFLLGIILIILSFLVGFAMLVLSQAELATNVTVPKTPETPVVEKKMTYGGVVLVGPVPIAFGSDKRIAFVMLIIGVAVAIALISILFLL